MALLTVRTFQAAGGAIARIAVNSTDTISGSDIGDRGVILDVNNASGGSINVTVGDPGTTPAGNAASGSPAGRVVAVPAGAQRDIYISPRNVDPATGVATITYSSTTSVTAECTRY
jgi:hypothetical protein